MQNEPRHRLQRALIVGTLFASSAALAGHGEGHHGPSQHCATHESTYEYQTLNWNPPFAEARFKETLDKLAKAGQAGFRIAKSLPDGSGGELLVLEREVTRCTEWH